MKRNTFPFTKSLISTAVSCMLMGTSVAQEADASDDVANKSGIERIVVTAERRGISENEMPISIMAFSGEQLENKNITDMERLQNEVPNLVFTDNGNTKYLNIRGVGISESAPNQTAGVAVHLDGAYIAREYVYGDAFFDLASVEVLRGPQGTYSGQNASGGAIFINSRKPVIGETEGFVSAELGSFNLTKYSAGVSFPLSDHFAMRISGNVESRDSFYSNHGADPTSDPSLVKNQPGNLERSMGRFQLLYSPSDALEMRLIHEVSRNNSDGVATIAYPEKGSTQLPKDRVWDLNYDMNTDRKVVYDRTTANIDWQIHEDFKLQGNVSSFKSTQDMLSDNDYGSYLTITDATQEGRDFRIEDTYWTGELTLLSTLDGPFEWTSGISVIDYDQDNSLNLLRYNSDSMPGTSLDLENHTRLYLYLNNIRKNKAVFAEVGYQLTSDLQVKAGLRYNKDEVGFSPKSYLKPGAGSYNATSGFPFPQQDLFDFEAVTGRVLANWQMTDDSLLYATISRGYKPGGTSPFGPEYDSEYVLNKELGWKSSFLDRKLDASVTVFHMDYDNFQRTYSPPNNPQESITRNVDGSTIAGIEVQLVGMLGDLRWNTSFSINDGQYGDLAYVLPAGAYDGVNPSQALDLNLKGKAIDYLPEKSANLGLEYLGWEFGNGVLLPSIRANYQAEYFTSFYQLDSQVTPSRTIWDLNLAYEDNTGWRVDVYAQNITDKLYVGRAEGGTNGSAAYSLGAPRQIGVKMKYQF